MDVPVSIFLARPPCENLTRQFILGCSDQYIRDELWKILHIWGNFPKLLQRFCQASVWILDVNINSENTDKRNKWKYRNKATWKQHYENKREKRHHKATYSIATVDFQNNFLKAVSASVCVYLMGGEGVAILQKFPMSHVKSTVFFHPSHSGGEKPTFHILQYYISFKIKYKNKHLLNTTISDLQR